MNQLRTKKWLKAVVLSGTAQAGIRVYQIKRCRSSQTCKLAMFRRWKQQMSLNLGSAVKI